MQAVMTQGTATLSRQLYVLTCAQHSPAASSALIANNLVFNRLVTDVQTYQLPSSLTCC